MPRCVLLRPNSIVDLTIVQCSRVLRMWGIDGVWQVRKPLDPNAIPFFSPRTLRKKVPPPLSVRVSHENRVLQCASLTETVSSQAKSFVDPAEALEQDEIAGMMEEFILETELYVHNFWLFCDNLDSPKSSIHRRDGKSRVRRDSARRITPGCPHY